MNGFLQKNYADIIKGALITLLLSLILSRAGLFIIAPTHVSLPVYIIVNVLGFVFCWMLISSLIMKFPLYKVLGVLGLLMAVIIAERFLDPTNNPFTIPLLILFWLGVAYLVLHDFFKKYSIAILTAYALVILSYFFFFYQMTPNYEENHRLNFVNIMLIPIPVFFTFWLYEQWRWLKTLKADKAKAELALLKSQVNPHFFFNTLNNLYGLVVEKSDKAPEVILKLSDIMRYTIYEGKEDLVLLKDELIYLESYIELHKIRYQKNVEISFAHDVDEGLKVAPLLYIILLENAFKHGVEKMHENAFIHLQMQSKGKQLNFTIENSFDITAQNKSKGIGLDNLKKRLDFLYFNRYELNVEEKGSIYKVRLTLELL